MKNEQAMEIARLLDLVLFECGCVGTRPNDAGRSVTFYVCDVGHNENPYGLGVREFGDHRTYDSLGNDVSDSGTYSIKQVGDLIEQGVKMETLRYLLDLPRRVE